MDSYFKPEHLAKFGEIAEGNSELERKFFDYYGSVFSNGALTVREKALIALAVSAQIPCEYCVIAQSKKARKAGATEEEIKEAIAVAAIMRKWSTMLNGYDKYTLEQFKADISAPKN